MWKVFAEPNIHSVARAGIGQSSPGTPLILRIWADTMQTMYARLGILKLCRPAASIAFNMRDSLRISKEKHGDCSITFPCRSTRHASVSTTSAQQVRRPVSSDGVEAWHSYEPNLHSLKEALGSD